MMMDFNPKEKINDLIPFFSNIDQDRQADDRRCVVCSIGEICQSPFADLHISLRHIVEEKMSTKSFELGEIQQ